MQSTPFFPGEFMNPTSFQKKIRRGYSQNSKENDNRCKFGSVILLVLVATILKIGLESGHFLCCCLYILCSCSCNVKSRKKYQSPAKAVAFHILLKLEIRLNHSIMGSGRRKSVASIYRENTSQNSMGFCVKTGRVLFIYVS